MKSRIKTQSVWHPLCGWFRQSRNGDFISTIIKRVRAVGGFTAAIAAGDWNYVIMNTVVVYIKGNWLNESIVTIGNR